MCLRNHRATISLPRIPDSKGHTNAIKEGAGKLSGDKDMETEGKPAV
jgi:hypothetical protein